MSVAAIVSAIAMAVVLLALWVMLTAWALELLVHASFDYNNSEGNHVRTTSSTRTDLTMGLFFGHLSAVLLYGGAQLVFWIAEH